MEKEVGVRKAGKKRCCSLFLFSLSFSPFFSPCIPIFSALIFEVNPFCCMNSEMGGKEEKEKEERKSGIETGSIS